MERGATRRGGSRRRTSSNPCAGSGAGPLIARCTFFWAAPILLMMLMTARAVNSPDLQSGAELDAVVAPLAVLLLISLANLVADYLLRCGGGLLILQVLVQILLLLSYLATPGGSPVLAEQAGPASPVAPERAKVPDPARLRGGPKPAGISIVLPCLNESTFTIQTVQSFCNRTPAEHLEEIIVVDDGSWPPLETILRDHIDERCGLRVLRHEAPVGLMGAKQTGGDAAVGKFIGFFDCHVAPRLGWHKEVVELLSAKARRLVIPLIGDLNISVWNETPNSNFVSKCYMNWNADWWWYDDDSDFTPVISGGLVSTTREWWQLTGGFDPGMHGWGGENTETALRTWLCGGDVVRARTSIVAHMWRSGADNRTIAKYSVKRIQVDNVARVAAAWFDDFKSKFRGGHMDPHINVTSVYKLKEKLGCKPFVHFLHRFRLLYQGGGMLPKQVFRIRSLSTQRCIQRHNKGYWTEHCGGGTWFHPGNQVPPAEDDKFPDPDSYGAALEAQDSLPDPEADVTCGGHHASKCSQCPQGHGSGWCHADCTWLFSECVPKDFTETVKLLPPKTCCSGLREWNSLDCMDNLEAEGPKSGLCDVTGRWTLQHYLFEESGAIRHRSGKCLHEGPDNTLVAGDCSSSSRWERWEPFEPEETKLYRDLVLQYGLTEDMPDH